MYRQFILEHAPTMLLALFAISATVKLLAISRLKYKAGSAELFFRSFFPYSKDMIRNAADTGLKNYYRKNNTFNTLLYFPFIGLLMLYVLMHLIS